MADRRVENLAKILVHYSTQIRPGDRVAIIGSPLAEPLINELIRYVLRAGGHPYPFMGLEMLRGMESFQEVFFKEASEEQLRHVLQTDQMIYENFESMITIRSQDNTRSLTNINPEKVPVNLFERGRGLRSGAREPGKYIITRKLKQAVSSGMAGYVSEFERRFLNPEIKKAGL